MATAIFWILFLAFTGAFAAQVATRVRLIAAAPNNFSVDRLGFRVKRFLVDVLGQRKTIVERPVAGLAHALVFWGFIAFGGYTTIEFLDGLGIAHLTQTRAFEMYRLVLTPFAVAVLAGIIYLLIRRAFVRPVALGKRVSAESILIGAFIAALMVTFLLTFQLTNASLAGRVNWWAHMLVILAFMALIPASKHFHLVLSPITVFLKSPQLGNLPNLDFEKEEVGLETVKDLKSKMVLDAFTCVECGRCQVNCPAWGSGKELNPKTIILQTQEALLAGEREHKLGEIYSEKALWQCTTCGACENQCPVGIEHLPILIGSRRGLVSNGDAPEYLGAVYNHLERRGNIWGLGYDQRQKFVDSAALEIFDPRKHDILVWLGCAGAFEADFQKSLRSLFEILRAKQVRFGVLSKEKCNGDPAKRTGNEYMFQELANANIEDLRAAGPKKILTSCPHCVKTIGDDYRRFGYEVEIVHSSVFVEELTRGMRSDAAHQNVTFHDPCYLGRYAGKVDEPRALLNRFGGDISEPVRNRENPFCCGAGGGLMFNDTEEEPGTRISDVRFKQLQDTGANTVVTACPFCSIMLKGAGASAGGAGENVQFVDLMTYVNGRLTKADPP
ncbi:MAG TPA: heterodisulfide reductase-related iron-sulfur binding cluster [Vicinamibacterales bacterium]|jgi:Fe-S oxidoreductase|nr:heterodisulfide reductase-related iron-sulfur binding cluster [Vicinamibacterales bacterium]